MLLERTPELEIPPKRGKTLIISVLVHAFLIAILVFNPDLFSSNLKRTIRIEGNDYDDAGKLTELDLRPVPRPSPTPKVDDTPLPPPPKTVQPISEAAPPPPPPPVRAIAPDDVLAPGARPDGQVQASRGSSSEPLRQGGAAGDSAPQAAPPLSPPPNPSRGNANLPPAVANNNPNAPTVPNLLQRANQIADNAIQRGQRGGNGSGATMGAKTGRSTAPNGQNFSADGGVEILSDTKGYDFGPYMNQVLNRVRNNWSIPDRAVFGARGRVVIDFTILKNGDVADCHIISESGERSLDLSAKLAIDLSNPFQQLPKGFTGNDLQLRFAFYYNMPVE